MRPSTEPAPFPALTWLLRLGLPVFVFALAYLAVYTLRFLRDYVPHGGIS